MVVFLTLGDGDFTYSLDLARYLSNGTAEQRTASPSSSHHLIATGIDSLEDLSKYQDFPSILQRIESQRNGTLSIDICHDVNAIVAERFKADDDDDVLDRQDQDHSNEEPISVLPRPSGNTTSQRHPLRRRADLVICNHPHLATEDAQRHSRFLCHLFYNVNHYWMKDEKANISTTTTTTVYTKIETIQAPIFHLTLVDGQFERWNCAKASERHGFTLIGQTPFVPPPVSTTTTTTTSHNAYVYRRHQSGRSFGRRAETLGGSTTYTFCRSKEKNQVAMSSLPWQQGGMEPSSIPSNCEVSTNSKPDDTPQIQIPQHHSCPFCDKTFVEQRSLQSHIRDKHADISNITAKKKKKKRKKTGGGDRIGNGMALGGESIQYLDQNRRSKTTTMIEGLNGGGDQQQSSSSSSKSLTCPYCKPPDDQIEAVPIRIFPTQQSLQDHIRAKHSGLHTYIAPDWSRAAKHEQEEMQRRQHQPQQGQDQDGKSIEPSDSQSSVVITCDICGYCLPPDMTMQQHLDDFIPSKGEERSTSFECNFCKKPFREDRAKRQHENFCRMRPPTIHLPSSCV